MLSFLFLASVANANNAFMASTDVMATAQRISLQVRAEILTNALNTARHGRRLDHHGDPCVWKDNACELGKKFALGTAAINKKPDLKKYAEEALRCENMDKAGCGSDAKCVYKGSTCEINDQESMKHMEKMYGLDKCGDFLKQSMSPPADACNGKDKASCTNTCEWAGGKWEYAKDTKKCVDASMCETKPPARDPKDPYGLKQQCPKMTTAQQTTCDAETDLSAKVACYQKVCPYMVIILGFTNCAAQKDEPTCKAAKPDLCAWDATAKRCGHDNGKLYGMMIPDTCPVRDMFLLMATCGEVKVKADCEKNVKCQWETQSDCDPKGAVQTADVCGGSDSNMMDFMFGPDLSAQNKKCVAVKTKAACATAKSDLAPQGKGSGITSLGTVPAISTFVTVLMGFLA